MSDIQTGNVKWFDDKKGYGFIVNESRGEVMVHPQSYSSGGLPAFDRRPASGV